MNIFKKVKEIVEAINRIDREVKDVDRFTSRLESMCYEIKKDLYEKKGWAGYVSKFDRVDKTLDAIELNANIKFKTLEDRIIKFESLEDKIKKLEDEIFKINNPNGKVYCEDICYKDYIPNSYKSVIKFKSLKNELIICEFITSGLISYYSEIRDDNTAMVLLKFEGKTRRFEIDLDKNISMEIKHESIDLDKYEFVEIN